MTQHVGRRRRDLLCECSRAACLGRNTHEHTEALVPCWLQCLDVDLFDSCRLTDELVHSGTREILLRGTAPTACSGKTRRRWRAALGNIFRVAGGCVYIWMRCSQRRRGTGRGRAEEPRRMCTCAVCIFVRNHVEVFQDPGAFAARAAGERVRMTPAGMCSLSACLGFASRFFVAIPSFLPPLSNNHTKARTQRLSFSLINTHTHTHTHTHTQREHARNITTACPRAGPETSASRTPSIKYWSCDQGSHQPHELQCGLLVCSSPPEQLRALRRRRCMLLHLSSCAC